MVTVVSKVKVAQEIQQKTAYFFYVIQLFQENLSYKSVEGVRDNVERYYG